MGDISKHFSRHEFACRGQAKGICDCSFDTIDVETLAVIEDVRTHFGVVVHINSGARCLKYNRHVGSPDGSQHLKGRAVDITVSGVSPAKVHTYLINKYPDKYGIGSYPTFTHIDTRNYKARW